MLDRLRRQHRALETRLDCLAAALSAADVTAARAAFAEAWPLAREHYAAEETSLFAAVRPHLPVLAAKMEAQHEEAREIAGHLETPDLPEREWLWLARRWLAIAQHNVIEEERDLFPLACDMLNGSGGQP